RWFLGRVSRHVQRANRHMPLILDQDPAAIMLGYSHLFLEDGMITNNDYAALSDRLQMLEERLRDWHYPRTVIFLDAPPEVLHDRCEKRWGKTKTPPLAWFKQVRDRFRHLFSLFPSASRISTGKLSVDEMISQATAKIRHAEIENWHF